VLSLGRGAQLTIGHSNSCAAQLNSMPKTQWRLVVMAEGQVGAHITHITQWAPTWPPLGAHRRSSGALELGALQTVCEVCCSLFGGCLSAALHSGRQAAESNWGPYLALMFRAQVPGDLSGSRRAPELRVDRKCGLLVGAFVVRARTGPTQFARTLLRSARLRVNAR